MTYAPTTQEATADLARLKDALARGPEIFSEELARLADHYEWREYKADVESAAQDVLERLRDSPDTDPSEALWESCDGWNIYYEEIARCLRQSDNPDAYQDSIGGDGDDAARAAYAFEQDVADYLNGHHPDWQTPEATA